jgi:hypothetical protein
MNSKFNTNININNNNLSKFIVFPKKQSDFDYPGYQTPEIKIKIEETPEEVINYKEDEKQANFDTDIEIHEIYNVENRTDFDNIDFHPENKLQKEPSLKLVVEKFLLKKRYEKNGWRF